jgi:hypothetical protein
MEIPMKSFLLLIALFAPAVWADEENDREQECYQFGEAGKLTIQNKDAGLPKSEALSALSHLTYVNQTDLINMIDRVYAFQGKMDIEKAQAELIKVCIETVNRKNNTDQKVVDNDYPGNAGDCMAISGIYENAAIHRNIGDTPQKALQDTKYTVVPEQIRKNIINKVYFSMNAPAINPQELSQTVWNECMGQIRSKFHPLQ